MSKYQILVEQAKNKRALQTESKLYQYLTEDHQNELDALAIDLSAINNHIKVDDEILNDAVIDYGLISKKLIKKLSWPDESIHILPQGSSSTKTLINSPDSSKFDIDAVCIVDASVIDVTDPMKFYELIGDALEEWKPIPKKRCWTITFSDRRYYLDFTPSTQLDKVREVAETYVQYEPGHKYSEKALAVVDTPTEKWKTSNPEGFSDWITNQSERLLLQWRSEDSTALKEFSESITPVPDQEVLLSDTLRIAIRLLKRHRDMSVKRGIIQSELKPISIIIVTLLTKCYEGLADMSEVYTHPIKLLIDLVDLMPHMLEERGNDYWVSNPTVSGENFSEKWNTNSDLKREFDTWTRQVKSDLVDIMDITDDADRSIKIKQVFGCTGAKATDPPTGSGLTDNKPDKLYKAPATKGLA